jgi:hypothetical protein
VQADALVNCLKRQLESEVPGSVMRLLIRVLCLGCLSGWRLRWLVSVGCYCREPFCLKKARAHFASHAEGWLTSVVCPGATSLNTKHGLRSGENTR